MKKEPMFKNWDDFVGWAEVYILRLFIEEGGKGIRGAIHGVINCYVNWQNDMKELEKKKK